LTGRRFDPASVFVIGDTPHDIEAGRAAGYFTIAVATGSHTVEELLAQRADLVLEDLASGRDQFLRSTRIL
jgi:phosphoglycolate phosphatase-like HAD superfamily hydrolase